MTKKFFLELIIISFSIDFELIIGQLDYKDGLNLYSLRRLYRKKKPSKFGIGIEGGFDLNDKQFYFDHEYSLFIYPEDKEIKLVGDNTTNESISDNVSKSLKSIINH